MKNEDRAGIISISTSFSFQGMWCCSSCLAVETSSIVIVR